MNAGPGRPRSGFPCGAVGVSGSPHHPVSPFVAGSVSARLANDGASGAVGSAAEASYGLELPAVAPAPETLPVRLVQDPCPVRELVQVEIGPVVQFEEDRPVSDLHLIRRQAWSR
jgi:hypothetical protein